MFTLILDRKKPEFMKLYKYGLSSYSFFICSLSQEETMQMMAYPRSLFTLYFLLLVASAASGLVFPIHQDRTFPIASFPINGSSDPNILG